jgi:hypothetical protein
MSEYETAERQVAASVSSGLAEVTHRTSAARACTDGIAWPLGDASWASAHAARGSRFARGDRSSVQGSLLKLQREYGNRFVGQVLRQGRGRESQGGDVDTDSPPDHLSQSSGARAFATERDVFFPQSEYRFGTNEQRPQPKQMGAKAHAAFKPMLARSTEDDMEAAANQAAEEARRAQSANPRFATTISNIGDIDQAVRVRDEILSYRPQLSAGIAAGEGFATPQQFQQNQNAIRVLDQYIGDARTQGSTLGDFQAQFEGMELDYSRLMGQMQAYAATAQGQGTNDSGDPTAVARAQIESTGSTVGGMQSDFRRATTSNRGSGNTAQHQEAARSWLNVMRREAQNVNRTQGYSVAAEHGARAATEGLAAVLAAQQAGDMQGAIAGLQQNAIDATKQVLAIGSFVKAATKLAVAPALTPGLAVETGVGVAVDVVNYVAATKYDENIAGIRMGLRTVQSDAARSSVSEATESAAQAKASYVVACQNYVDASKNLEHAQREYRASMREMGASADTASGGGNAFQVVAQILSEADAYLAQADATISIGEREVEQSHTAAASAGALRNVREGRAVGTVYFRPYQTYHRGVLSWGGSEQTFRLLLAANDDVRTGSAEGARMGVNPVMERALQQLRVQREEVARYAGELRQVFNTGSVRSAGK